MRKSLIAIMVVLALSAGAWGQKVVGTITGNSCLVMPTASMATAGILVSGTWTGALKPQVTIGAAGYADAYAVAGSNGVATSTITANGAFSSGVAGFDNFQLCGQSVTGTATVTMYAVTVSSKFNM